MNGKSQGGSQLEMRWSSIVAAGQPKRQCSQLVTKWISIASRHSQLSIGGHGHELL
jgi:hypothetical protein